MRPTELRASYPTRRRWIITAVLAIGGALITLATLIEVALSAAPINHVIPLIPSFLGVCILLAMAGIALVQAALLRRGLPAVSIQRVGRLLRASTPKERRLIHLCTILFAFIIGVGTLDILYSAV